MIQINPQTKTFHLSCDTFSYVLQVEDGQLLNLYWGAPLSEADLTYLLPAYQGGASFETRASRMPLELPSMGAGWYGAPALQAENQDGNNLTCLVYRDYKVLPHKPHLPGLPQITPEEGDGETLQLQLVDPLTGLEAVLSYTAAGGGLVRSMQLTNHGSAPLTLTHMASARATVSGRDLEVMHLRGAWARERRPVRIPVGQSSYLVESQRGASGHEENPFLALMRPHTTEDSGDVWAMNLVYSGSFAATAQVNSNQDTALQIGLNPAVHRWLLKPGESFTTPEAVLVYSDRGLNGMSQIFHHLYRDCLCRSPWVHRERPILVNNWEATYFDFNEEKILQIAQAAARIGIELFVLDDGWFGRRDDDHSSLGDWYVNTRKLPGGLRGLAEKIGALGLQFGLWLEPEMISPDSDLYRTDVQDYIIRTVRDILSSAPIAYVKWDMNRNMTEAFSALLPPQRQMETQHRYMLGLYRVMDEITSAFPEVLFEGCSGGGGRFDPGILYYMPQIWTSDDSDALERISIQYGTSYVYPPSSMCNHVSAVPNHQVGRVTGFAMRGDAALGGSFGFELDFNRLPAEELAAAQALIERVKALRSLTQTGRFTRLLSPFEGSNFAAWQFTGENQVLLCCFRKLSEPNPWSTRVYLRDLDPCAHYTDEQGLTYSGSALMQAGLPMTFFPQQDFTSCIILFTKTEEPYAHHRNLC